MLQMSNLTPDSFVPGADPVETQRPRKRQRKVLSCDSCHRQKVKCDRQQPCARCIAGNRSEHCTYKGLNDNSMTTSKQATTTLQQPSPAASDSTLQSQSQQTVKKPIGTVWRKGRARFSGLTHWAQLAFQFEEAVPFIKGNPCEVAHLVKKMKQLKYLYPSKRLRAFPFGDSGSNTVLSTLGRLSFLPPKALTEQLVENYLNTFELTHPLLEVQTFQEEFYQFWDHPETVSDAWLAQLYMMLSLSCYSNHEISFTNITGGNAGLSERCIDGAEAALTTRGQFMTKPDITTLRTLCMIAIAKRMDLVTLDDSDALWVFMGFVVRVGMSMCLHIGASAFSAMPHAEAIARRRIWTTLMILDATIALDSGMPMLLRPEDYDSSALALQGPQSSPVAQKTNESSNNEILENNAYQNLLSEAVPILLLVLNKVNSPSPVLGQDQIMSCDQNVRQLLQKAQSCLPFQRRLLEVFFHRCLLALHQINALECDAPDSIPTNSLRTLHDSSLSMLHIQLALYERPSQRWLADVFHRDFGIAGLYVCVGLRNGTYIHNTEDLSFSKLTAWHALRKAHSIIKDNIFRSRHYYKVYKGYSVVIAILQALEAGEPIREAVYKSGLEVITVVEEVMGAQSNNQVMDPLTMNPTLFSGSAQQANFNFDAFSFGFDEFINDFFW